MSAILNENDAIQHLKVPPHSIEAEQSVLGGLLLDNTAWDKVADVVAERDFYRQDHRLIFRSIAILAEKDEPLDVITLSSWLKDRDELENAGGLAYLGTLAKTLQVLLTSKLMLISFAKNQY